MEHLAKRRLRARFGNGNRIYLTEWVDGTWSFGLVRRTGNTELTVASGDKLQTRDDAQSAALNAILKLPAEDQNGFSGSLDWQVVYPTGPGNSQRSAHGLRTKEMDERRKSLALVTQTVAVLLTVTGLAFTAINALKTQTPSEITALAAQSRAQQQQIADLRQTIAGFNGRLETLTRSLKEAPSNTKLTDTLAVTQRDVAELQRKLSSFEIGLGDDPAKRVAILMLRKDLDVVTDKERADITSLQTQFTQTFDTMKWLIALLGGGIIASIASNWLSRPKT